MYCSNTDDSWKKYKYNGNIFFLFIESFQVRTVLLSQGEKEMQEENTNTSDITDQQHFISSDRKRDCTLRWTESGGRSNSLERKAARRSASHWNLSRSHQQLQWPVMCGFNCNKTVKFARGPHVKRGQSAHEIWRPVSAATKLDVLQALVHLQKPFTLTPQIPAATSFSLTAHHLLTHRLTSLTLRSWGRGCIHETLTEGKWLRVCDGDPYPKLNKTLVGWFESASWSHCR